MKRALFFLIATAFAASSMASMQDDMIVFRPATSAWLGSYSVPGGFSNGTDTSLASFGDTNTLGELMVADFNGDGIDDMAVIENNNGFWRWVAAHSVDTEPDGNGEMSRATTSTGTFGFVSHSMGNLVGDINGDGLEEIVTVDEWAGAYYWGTTLSTHEGLARGDAQWPYDAWGSVSVDDRPIIGDFNGDGMDDTGVWRPSSGGTYIRLTGGTVGSGLLGAGATTSGQIGGPTWELTLVGDVNGDGRDDLVLVDTNAGTGNLVWVAAFGQANGVVDWATAHNEVVSFGWAATDLPLLADINGDGRDDMVAYRPGAPGSWFVSFTEAGGSWADTSLDATGSFGASGDIPLFGQLNALFMRVTIEKLADALTLAWGTDLGRSYVFESKTNLMGATWTSNATFLGTGGDITVTTGVDQAQSFFRVVAE